ncbi:diacylglycerol kinase 4 [Hordeum vulgare]|nr:diacylglycerol kinase 4 [Hordeum vulgare]
MRSRSRSCSEMSISLSASSSSVEREALRLPRSPPAAPPALVGALIESLSFRSCGFGRAASSAFEKEDLRLRVALPQRLRDALHASLKARDPSAGAFALVEAPGIGTAANPWFALAPEDAPENPLVAFVNPRSGGRLGPVLKSRLQELLGEDQVKLLPLFHTSM